MTKTKSTKRALLLSALALITCVSMLVGSTFAWFTDSVTSSGNIIKSGTLEVTMEWAEGSEAVPADDSADWINAEAGAIFDYDLWEPGFTQVRHIKIANEGSLALKYQIGIKANGEVSDLADVIDVYYADPAVQVADRAALAGATKLGTLTEVLNGMSTTASGSLEAGKSDTITIALKMQETAGNEYQNKAIGADFSVILTATQYTSEEDSFDKQYDKMATIDSAEELAEALAGDYDLIVLGSNIEFGDVSSYAARPATETLLIPADKELTVDLNGYTLSQAKTQAGAYALIANKGTLTIKDSIGTGKISYEDITAYTADPGWASNTIRNEGVLHILGGTVENISSETVKNFGYPHAIDVYQGSVTNINGGTVKSLNYDAIRMFCNSETLATEVNITGGTIINRISFQDPAASRAGYGILNISGGNFITTGDVNANVRMLNFSNVSNNMKATVTGGTFDKGFKTQDIVSAGVKLGDWLDADISLPANTVDNVKDLLAQDMDVILQGDITFTGVAQTPDRNNYVEVYGNKTGFAQYGGVLDGNGNALIDNEGDRSYVVVTHGGTIKNLTINTGARGIVTYSPTENVYIDNVVVDGPGYALNSTEHAAVDMVVTNSTINGWTSLAGFNSVSFTNCKLGENSAKYWQSMGYDQDYDRLFRVYSPTTYTECEFQQGYYLDMSAGGTAALIDCTVNGVEITAENYAEYITIEVPGGKTLAECVTFG